MNITVDEIYGELYGGNKTILIIIDAFNRPFLLWGYFKKIMYLELLGKVLLILSMGPKIQRRVPQREEILQIKVFKWNRCTWCSNLVISIPHKSL